MDGEDAEEGLFEGPLGSVVLENELVVLEIVREELVLHELVPGCWLSQYDLLLPLHGRTAKRFHSPLGWLATLF